MLHKAKTKVSTKYGDFVFYSYQNDEGLEHLALIKGDVSGKENVFCRLHSACITGDVFHSLECICASELELAMKICEKEGTGIIIWMNHDSISAHIENFNKITQKKIPRDFTFASKILNDLRVKSICLMTRNDRKIEQLKETGINIIGKY